MADRRSGKHYASAGEHSARSADNRSASNAGRRSRGGDEASRRAGVPQHAASRSEGAEMYSARRRRKGHGKIIRNVLIVVVALVAVVGVAFASYISSVDEKLTSDVDDSLLESLATNTSNSDPFYMLILGVDKSESRSESWGSDTSNFRADTIILMRVDPVNCKITVISIPRDTMVEMGDYGTQKINAAYSLGGASYMVDVVEELAGVEISHYAEVDFEAFEEIVDAVGGITVTLPVDVVDEENAGINLSAGTHELDGETALALVRTRHAYDDYGAGDYYRAANQRMVIAAILDKLFEQDLGTIASIIQDVAEDVTTDLTVSDLVGLATSFVDIDTDEDFYSGQCPTESQYINSLWYEVVDEDEWATMMARVENGESPYADESEDVTAGVAGSAGTYTGTSDTEAETTAQYTGYVYVLNGTDVSGLAATNCQTLDAAGFTSTAGNAGTSDVTSSYIVYNSGDDDYAIALGVADTLGLDDSVIESNDGSWTTDYSVVVVLGTDVAE